MASGPQCVMSDQCLSPVERQAQTHTHTQSSSFSLHLAHMLTHTHSLEGHPCPTSRNTQPSLQLDVVQ